MLVSDLLGLPRGPPPPYTSTPSSSISFLDPPPGPPPYKLNTSPPEYFRIVNMRAQPHLICPFSGIPTTACRGCIFWRTYDSYNYAYRAPTTIEERLERERQIRELVGMAAEVGVVLALPEQDAGVAREEEEENQEDGDVVIERVEPSREGQRLYLRSRAAEMARRRW